MSSPTGSSPSWRSLPGLAPLKTRRPSAHLRRPETAAELEYVSVGCNRSVHGLDWNHEDAPGGGLVAYGAHTAVAVYDPAGARVLRTLPGHDAPVTVVRWIPDARAPGRWLVSGDAAGAVILWHRTDNPARSPDAGSVADEFSGRASRLDPESHRWRVVARRKAHDGPVLDARAEHTFAQGEPCSSRLLVTASQDCLVRLWRLDLAPAPAPAPASAADAAAAAPPAWMPLAARGRLSFPLKRLPLSAALARLPGTDRLVLAVGGADGGVRLSLCDTSGIDDGIPREGDAAETAEVTAEAAETAQQTEPFEDETGVLVESCATLAGHTDWVRDLAFTSFEDTSSEESGNEGLLLASASQDRTARVWRVRVAPVDDTRAADDGARVPAYARLARPPAPPSASLGGDARVSAALEALLQGHEDWVMSVAWRPSAFDGKSKLDGELTLLTASADRSLIHWTPEEETRNLNGGDSGERASETTRVWMASESVGDAASSCLGFYGAAFDASARRVLAHAHGGALHAWRRAGSRSAGDERWALAPASAGHAGDATCLSWDAAGRFLLSGSADLTTRLHASWESRVDEDELRNLRDVHKPVAVSLEKPTTGWREIARPQIHGHAVRCVAALPPPGSCSDSKAPTLDAKTVAGGSTAFVSGADEKTLRVFDAPGTFLGTLARSLPRADRAGRKALEAARGRAADASGGAELPQLGLSNKALRAPEPAAMTTPASPTATDTAWPTTAAGDGGFSFASFAGEHGFGVDPDPMNSLLPPESAPMKSPPRRRRDGVIEGERRQDVLMLTPERPHEAPLVGAAAGGSDDKTPVVTRDAARRGDADAAASVAAPKTDASSDPSEPRVSRVSKKNKDPDASATSIAELMAATAAGNANASGDGAYANTFGSVTPAILSRPPAEEALASATLWPEARKLYGHGDDVSCVAAHPAGTLVASACEARSESASSIWVWDASRDWRPLGKLHGATLTVVALHFASPARGSTAATPAGAGGSPGFFGGDAPSSSPGTPERSALLAASRDRHISIYVPSLSSVADGTGAGAWGSGWTLATRVKAHAKALYDAKWAPLGHDAFATAARDKRVKVWRVDEQSGATADESIAPFNCAATAVAFAPRRVRGKLILAVGLEDGTVRLLAGDPQLGPSSARRGGGANDSRVSGSNWTVTCSVAAQDAHVGAVRALAWRPFIAAGEERGAGDGNDDGADESDLDESDSQSGSPVFSFFGLSLGDPEEEDDEADGPMLLASCGADHAVRVFSVRRAGGSAGILSQGRTTTQREAGGGGLSPLGKPAKEDSTSSLGSFFGFA